MKRSHLLCRRSAERGAVHAGFRPGPTQGRISSISAQSAITAGRSHTIRHAWSSRSISAIQIETSYVENVNYGPDAERVMTQMALSGTDMIFATSFGYGPDMNNVAERFPDVAFGARHRLHPGPAQRLALQCPLLRGPGSHRSHRRQDDRDQHRSATSPRSRFRKW